MPKYEFIGTKGNSTGEYHLYRDETGKVIEVPASIAGSKDKEAAELERNKKAVVQEWRNAGRAEQRGTAIPHPRPFIPVDEAGVGHPELGFSTTTPEARRLQDIGQVDRHRRDLAFKANALAEMASLKPPEPPPVPLPPEEQIQKQPTEHERLAKMLERAGYGNQMLYSAKYKTGMLK